MKAAQYSLDHFTQVGPYCNSFVCVSTLLLLVTSRPDGKETKACSAVINLSAREEGRNDVRWLLIVLSSTKLLFQTQLQCCPWSQEAGVIRLFHVSWIRGSLKIECELSPLPEVSARQHASDTSVNASVH